MYETSKDVDLNVASFLLSYRNTPHSVTNQPPAILMYGRTLRSKLNSIRPSDTVEKNALNVENEKMVPGKKRPEIRKFVCNQPVWVRPDNSKEYVPAVVKQKTGNWYEVSCRGRALKKHVDAIKGIQAPPIIATKSAESVTASPEITPIVSTRNITTDTPVSEPVSTDPTTSTRQAPRIIERLRNKARVNYKEMKA